MLVCQQLTTVKNIYGGYDCKVWVNYVPVEQQGVFSDLANLTLHQVNDLWMGFTLLFATAYIFKRLPFFMRLRS